MRLPLSSVSSSNFLSLCRISLACSVIIAGVGHAGAQGSVPTQSGRSVVQLNRRKAAQSANTDILKEFNNSLEALAQKVSPAVVQVLVTGFGPLEDQSGGTNATVLARQQTLASGVIVDPDGYIITNAHVVAGAQTIRVALTLPTEETDTEKSEAKKKEYNATLLGVHTDTDLALLKIDAKQLPFLPIEPQRPVRQGELVVALGSPEGLQDTVTMGVVSSVNRQADPSRPMVYIQTDAPINRGNSGGPLVDVDGYMVGINTFIVSSSGGSEGLGFAIPARIVNFVYQRLRKFGHVDRSEIGAAAIAITPTLAEGLQLPVRSGVMIEDVTPGGPAESSGLKIEDVILSIDGRPIRSLPMLNASLYLHPTGEIMTVEVLRGTQRLTLHIPVITQKHEVDRLLDLADPEKNLVPRLNIVGVTLNENIAKLLPDLRISSGVVVVANTFGGGLNAGLRPGDIIHAINNEPVTTVEQLRAVIDAIKPGQAVVIQIEREGSLDFVSFETA
jgi:serine protease Do